jgi:hypothetical protein
MVSASDFVTIAVEYVTKNTNKKNQYSILARMGAKLIAELLLSYEKILMLQPKD